LDPTRSNGGEPPRARRLLCFEGSQSEQAPWCAAGEGGAGDVFCLKSDCGVVRRSNSWPCLVGNTGKPTLSVSTGGTVAGESAILAVRFCEICGFHAGYWKRPHYWITENAVYQCISYYIISGENCTKFGRMIIQRI